MGKLTEVGEQVIKMVEDSKAKSTRHRFASRCLHGLSFGLNVHSDTANFKNGGGSFSLQLRVVADDASAKSEANPM